MAPHVRFQPAGPYERIGSHEPFRREWDAMIEDNALAEINRTGLRRMLALRSSGAEYFVPNAFRILFVLVAVGTHCSRHLPYPAFFAVLHRTTK